jgi:hypothetical protein
VFLQQRLRAIEGVLVDQRLVQPRECLLAPMDAPDVRLVGEYPEHDRRLPASCQRRRVLRIKPSGYRGGSESSRCVPLEDATDDRRGALVWDQLLVLVALARTS